MGLSESGTSYALHDFREVVLVTSLLTESSGAYSALYKLNRCAE